MAVSTVFYANPFIVTMINTDGSVGTWTPPAKCRIVDARGYMTGAGATGDAMNATDGTNDICDDVDTHALGDTDILSNGLGEIDDAHRDLIPGTDVLTGDPTSASKTAVSFLLVWTD